jgi:hypothetical protein
VVEAFDGGGATRTVEEAAEVLEFLDSKWAWSIRKFKNSYKSQ